MSQITKNLSGFLFNGADLTLATAAFKANIGTLSGFNAAGTGYTSFKPGNLFNSLTTLKQDGSYILSAATVGFDLPGATLVAAGTVPMVSPLSVTNYGAYFSANTALPPTLQFVLTSDDAADNSVVRVDNVIVTIDELPELPTALATVGYGSIELPGAVLGSTLTARFVTNNGNMTTQIFTVLPAKVVKTVRPA